MRHILILSIGLLLATPGSPAETLTVTGRIILVPSAGRGRAVSDNSDAVVYLTPREPGAPVPALSGPPSHHFRLVQKNKRFTPHILVVPVGAVVEFPNLDPFFHNVFSLFEGKRFDLGLYEAGATRSITFNQPGVSYIFCNIHPEMSAVIVVIKYPFYALSTAAGDIAIRGVPAGRYQLSVWYERSLPESLKPLSRVVSLSPGASSLGDLRVAVSGDLLSKHKNLYGRDYDPSQPSYSPLF